MSGTPEGCYVVDVDGEPVRIHGQGEHLTDKDRQCLAEVVRAAKAMVQSEWDRLTPQEQAAKDQRLTDARGRMRARLQGGPS
jgi:hypothetical protein